jgi:hypothetical protein
MKIDVFSSKMLINDPLCIRNTEVIGKLAIIFDIGNGCHSPCAVSTIPVRAITYPISGFDIGGPLIVYLSINTSKNHVNQNTLKVMMHNYERF